MARRRLGFLPLARESASFVRGAFGVPFVRTRLADRPFWEALTRGAEYGIGTRTTVLPVAARLRLLPDRGALAPRCANRTSLALRLVTAPAEVRYARASGDVDIAYTVFGEGQFDLVVVMGFVTHLDLEWQFPWFQDIRALGQACRVLVFDKRGTGLSDRSLGYGSLEERTDDIRAVMDAAGSRRAVVYGISEAGSMALLFAATYPDRAQALVLYGTFARCSQAPGYPIGVSPEEADAFIDLVAREWTLAVPMGGSTSSTSPTPRRPPGSSPSSSATPAPRRWWLRSSGATSRSTCGPSCPRSRFPPW